MEEHLTTSIEVLKELHAKWVAAEAAAPRPPLTLTEIAEAMGLDSRQLAHQKILSMKRHGIGVRKYGYNTGARWYARPQRAPGDDSENE